MKEKLRYLINKIKSKPKLVKALKIIKRIFNVCVYAFTILMVILLSVGGCSNTHNDQATNTSKQVVEKYAYEHVDGGAGYYYNNGLSLIYEFIPKYLNDKYPVFNDDLNNEDILYNLSIYCVPYQYFGETTPTHITTTITEIWLSPTLSFTLGNTWFVKYYVSFVTNNGHDIIDLPFSYIPPVFKKNNVVYNNYTTTNGAYIVDFLDANLLTLDNTAIMFSQAENPHIYKYLVGVNMGDVNEYYNVGYGDGYEAGKSLGYQQGLTAGQASNSTNIFSIVQTGFDAVATLFNIQIFPGITIATLMFIPLIVLLIIALMHIFKG